MATTEEFDLTTMEDDGSDNDKDKLEKLTFLVWIGCVVTILACLATCMAFIGYRLLNSVRSVIRMSFLGVLALGETCFIAGVTLYSDIPAVCSMIAVFTHFACLSSFSWLLSYVLFLGNEIKGETQHYALSMGYYAAIGWGVPGVTVLISFIWKYKDYKDKDYCWLRNDDSMELAFIVPAGFLMLASYSMLFYVYHIYRKAIVDPKKELTFRVTRSGIRSCFVLVPVLGTTWLLGVVTLIFRDIYLQAAFSISNVILGVLVFVFMFLWNEEIIQKRKEGKGFFPASSKEKRAKEAEKKERKSKKNWPTRTHPLMSNAITQDSSENDDAQAITKVEAGLDENVVSQLSSHSMATKETDIPIPQNDIGDVESDNLT